MKKTEKTEKTTKAGDSIKLYNISGKLVGAPAFKTNINGKPFATVVVERTEGKKITVMTYVKAGIKALEDKKEGDEVKLYGTFKKGEKGQTFSSMGNSPEKAPATDNN